MNYGKLLFEELNKWTYNYNDPEGNKIKLIDASDIPEIINSIVYKILKNNCIASGRLFLISLSLGTLLGIFIYHLLIAS